jgi:hypothetical protein
MTREDIIRMARQAEDYADTIYEKGEYHPGWLEVRDTHFAALVAAAEREACARVCDKRGEQSRVDGWYRQSDAELRCADAIRARGSK